MPRLGAASGPHARFSMHPHHLWFLGYTRVSCCPGASWEQDEPLLSAAVTIPFPLSPQGHKYNGSPSAPALHRSSPPGAAVSGSRGITHSTWSQHTPTPHREKPHGRTHQASSGPPQAEAQGTSSSQTTLSTSTKPCQQSSGGAHPAHTHTSCSRC